MEGVVYFTVRELARLQTFADSWHFANSWTESRRQLGNAVPVQMAEMLAGLIRNTLGAVTPAEQNLGREAELALLR